jgi:transcriptional regulator
MDNRITIKVKDLIGGPLCISAEDGQKIFDKIEPLLKDGKPITISFEHVSVLVSLFLNAAIGQLYGSFSEEEVRALVQVEGLSVDDLELLKHVVDNAKKYYANPKGYDSAWQAEEEDEDEQ